MLHNSSYYPGKGKRESKQPVALPGSEKEPELSEVEIRRKAVDEPVEKISLMGKQMLGEAYELRALAEHDRESVWKDDSGQWCAAEGVPLDEYQWLVIEVDLSDRSGVRGDTREALVFDAHRSEQAAIAQGFCSFLNERVLPHLREWGGEGVSVLSIDDKVVVVLPRDERLVSLILDELSLDRFYDTSNYE